MFALVFAMLVVLAVGVTVVGSVALPARRDGRPMLTARGERLVESALRR